MSAAPAGGDGWDAAADWTGDGADRERAPTPRPQAQLPIGGGRRLVEVVACPVCDSPLVARDGVRKVGDALAYWHCRECPATWKEAAAVGVSDRRGFLT